MISSARSEREVELWRNPALITGAALVIRLLYLWIYQHGKSSQALGSISFLYEPGNIAYSLAAHKGFSSPFRVETGPTAWMTPVYPGLVAAVFEVFGTYTYGSFLAATVLNIVASAFTCIPLYSLGKQVGSFKLGSLAAWLWAVFPNAVVLSVRSLWDASLSALLLTTLLSITVTLGTAATKRGWKTYGLLWGLAMMTNPSLGSVLPFFLGWIAYRRHRRRQKWIWQISLPIVITALCCVPWTVRNFAVFGTLVPLRSVFGLQLWMGNNDRVEKVWPGSLHPLANSVERDRYIQLGEIAYMSEKRSQAIQFIRAHPQAEERLIADRIVTTWSGGTPHPIGDLIHNHSAEFRFILLSNLVAGLGAAAGLAILYRRRNEFLFPLVIVPIAFPVLSYLTLASARYRHPIDGVILLLTAAAVRPSSVPVRSITNLNDLSEDLKP